MGVMTRWMIDTRVQELGMHSRWVRHQRLEDIHSEPIRKLIYMAENDCVISSSGNSRNSLVIMDIQRKKKTYVFKMNKVRLGVVYMFEVRGGSYVHSDGGGLQMNKVGVSGRMFKVNKVSVRSYVQVHCYLICHTVLTKSV